MEGYEGSRCTNVLSIAPMIQWTDRYFRFLMRQLTRRTLLYSEMTMDNALLYNAHALAPFIGHDACEHPLAVQLGGSEASSLAEAAYLCESFASFAEINLNAGCPSNKAKRGGNPLFISLSIRIIIDSWVLSRVWGGADVRPLKYPRDRLPDVSASVAHGGVDQVSHRSDRKAVRGGPHRLRPPGQRRRRAEDHSTRAKLRTEGVELLQNHIPPLFYSYGVWQALSRAEQDHPSTQLPTRVRRGTTLS